MEDFSLPANLFSNDLVEVIRKRFYPDLTYASYLMIFQLTGSLWLPLDYRTAGPNGDGSAFKALQEAQVQFDDLNKALREYKPRRRAMTEKLIPAHMRPFIETVRLIEEENVEAEGASDVVPSLDQAHAWKLGVSRIAISFFRNSDLTQPGSLAHYCLAQTYVDTISRLHQSVIRMKDFLDWESGPGPRVLVDRD